MSSETNPEKNMSIDRQLDQIEQRLGCIARGLDYKTSSSRTLSYENSGEIDLRVLWGVVWQGKWIIIAITFSFFLSSILVALSLPNMYKSEALLAPAEENSGGGLAGMVGQLGGLASLAGVNFGGRGANKTALALEVLKSREFISYFIKKHDVLVPLMAAKGWDRETDTLVIDSKVYDSKTDVWLRDVSPPLQAKPSEQEAIKKFSKIFGVVQNKKTNFVSISVEFYSPNVAKKWVDLLIDDINRITKDRDVAEAERSVRYLNEQLEKTSIADMKSVFYELIEEHTKIIMFAEVRDEYAFKTIDRAIAPELKSKPKRSLIVVLGVLVGGMLGVLIVFIRYFLNQD